MSSSKTSKSGFGLVLNLPGAPATWHEVPELGFRLHPSEAVSLTDAGLSQSDAEAWIKAHTPPSHTDVYGRDGENKQVVVGKIPLDAECIAKLVPLNGGADVPKED